MTPSHELAIRKSPLEETHRALGAIMTDVDGWSLPASYGDELFEYAAVRERGAGMIDLSARGRFRVSGSEAISFLNGLVTNDMKTLAANQWMPAVFPNVQGRLLASVRIIRLADENPTFIIDTEAATHKTVFQTIQKFTYAGDFQVTDLTSETTLLSLQGRQASKILDEVLGVAPPDGERTLLQTAWQNESLTVVRANHTGALGFDLIIDSTHAAELWRALVAAGARPVGQNAFEILRIEAGEPRYGRDMDDTNVVTETNLDDAVSYTKGCYIGQEIIARIKYRGHVAKKLRGLLFSGPRIIEPGATIRSLDAKEIGRLTSSTLSPILGRRIALGYVKYEYIAAGTEVRVADDLSAQVVDLPFVGLENDLHGDAGSHASRD